MWQMNNISTEWYYGAKKGAAGCLRERSGNAWDQASLLMALMKAASFGSRILTGVASFFPDLSVALDLTGLDNAVDVAHLFRLSGIPHEFEIRNGEIVNIRFEHTWVESYIPYGVHRGTSLRDTEKHWMAMCTTLKVRDFISNRPDPILEVIPLHGIRGEYLQTVRAETPLSFLKNHIEIFLSTHKPDIDYKDLLKVRTLPPERFSVLPASLQFNEIAVNQESTSIPEELVHMTRFIASGQGEVYFDESVETYALSNEELKITFEPASIEDQIISNTYGGIDSTPPHLFRVRPVLVLGKSRRIAVGESGMQMGRPFDLEIRLTTPNGEERFSNAL
ncbi:MAG: hypothetical protein GY835_23565, partial [bacterium]|nr:hypothetical protein [bacterium]